MKKLSMRHSRAKYKASIGRMKAINSASIAMRGGVRL